MDGARQVVMQTLEQSSEEEKGDYGVIKEKIAPTSNATFQSKRKSGH